SNPRALRRRHGVELHSRAVDASGATVAFDDQTSLDVDAVLWATGFRPDYSWIDADVFDEKGGVVHKRGVTDAGGLYFLGLTWQHTRGSALLGWVKEDARYLSERIRAHRSDLAVAAATPQPVACHGASLFLQKENDMGTTSQHFPTAVDGLQEARPPEIVELADGDEFQLVISPVAKRLGTDVVRMLAYNGSI